MREWFQKNRRALVSRTLIILGVGGFLGFVGAYQTDGLPLLIRYAYWIVLIGFGMFCGELVSTRIIGRFGGRLPAWGVIILIASLVSLPVTALVSIFNLTLMRDAAVLRDFPFLYVSVWVISAAISALGSLLHRMDSAGQSMAPDEALLLKLPPRLRQSEIWAFEAEDHYLRVRTNAGEALILMRLGDAMASVGSLPGMQTHRSWWVAEAGVEKAKRESGGRGAITLKDGAIAPVSRAHAPKLRELGWL